jgi:flagellin-like protein
MEEEKEKKAAQGIGTLIIFIAMILVAAVAAGVLIQTAASLQSKSLDVGRQSQEKITTDLDVLQIVAYDTSDGVINEGIDNLSVTVRLGTGSATVKLSDTLLKIDSSVSLKSSNFVYAADSLSPSTYSSSYLINGSNHVDGYLVAGETVQLNFQMPIGSGNITESQSLVLRLIAKNGAVKPIKMSMPSAIVDVVTYLYP